MPETQQEALGKRRLNMESHESEQKEEQKSSKGGTERH